MTTDTQAFPQRRQSAVQPANRFPKKSPPESTLVEMLSLTHWRSFVLETLALIVVIVVISGGSMRASLPGGLPHPLWIPIVLISAQYGVIGGIFAVASTTATDFALGLQPQSAALDFYEYTRLVAQQPTAWFATALAIGGLRTLHIHQFDTIRVQLDDKNIVAQDLSHGLDIAAQEIAKLEWRIASDTRTLACFSTALSKLNMSDANALVDSYAGLIRHGVGAIGFSIYLERDGSFVPTFGFENGNWVPTSLIPPLTPPAVKKLHLWTDRRKSCGDIQKQHPIAVIVPIQISAAHKPIGVIICHKLVVGIDRREAERRLADLSRTLAILLEALPSPRVGACSNA